MNIQSFNWKSTDVLLMLQTLKESSCIKDSVIQWFCLFPECYKPFVWFFWCDFFFFSILFLIERHKRTISVSSDRLGKPQINKEYGQILYRMVRMFLNVDRFIHSFYIFVYPSCWELYNFMNMMGIEWVVILYLMSQYHWYNQQRFLNYWLL